MLVLATELPGFQKGMLTTSLTGHEWLACFGLAALLPVVIETGKWQRRRTAPASPLLDTQRAVGPARGLAGTTNGREETARRVA
jgi:Ca2+-transporting ATPase